MMENARAIPPTRIGGGSPVERINELKCELLSVCDNIVALAKDGIRIEFQIVDGKLMSFRALQEIKLSS